MKKVSKKKANKRRKPGQRNRQHNWRGRQPKWQRRLKMAVLIAATLLGALAVIAKAYHFFSVHLK
ncbi:hypothetical protein C1N53_22305 (plasmid) [Pontibacter sp. SGAir0037]|nr:hypothetical protein C1N53_22305 [Pontibacter sp. SGAir0037]